MDQSGLEFLCDAKDEALIQTVDEVIKKYRNGEMRAAVYFTVNTITKSSGVLNVELKLDDVSESVDMSAVLENLYSCVSSESLGYLLVNKDTQYKHFGQRFSELWKYFIKTSFSSEILFQDRMLPSLALWLVAMSESKCRSFRHTATVAVLWVIQSLNELVENLKARLTFVRDANEMASVKLNIDKTVQWRDHLFSQTVHQRLRDIAPEIRFAATQQLKKWVFTFPEEFMEKQYLRYFSMSLHDKRPNLRAEGLDMIIQGLGRVEGAYDRMKLFLEYFIQRLVEMSSDVDAKCAELALRALAMIVKRAAERKHASAEIVTSEMIDLALRALFDERQTVRTAAGVLLHVFVYTRCTNDNEMGDDDDGRESMKIAGNLITSFAETLRQQYKEEMAEKYLVDALWNSGNPPPVLLETPIMIDYSTSRNPSEAKVGLGFFAAVLQKLQGNLHLGPAAKDERRAAAPKLSSNKKDKLLYLQKKLSVDAVHVLSQVLQTHGEDCTIMQSVAELSRAIDLSALTSSVNQSALSAVMMGLRVFCTSSTLRLEERLLQTLILAWHHFVHRDHPQRGEAEGHIHEIRNLVRKELNQKNKGSRAEKLREQEALAARCELLSSLQPLKELFSSAEVVFGCFLNVAESHSIEITKATIAVFLNEILWEVKVCCGESAGAEANEVLRDLSKKLVDICFTSPKEMNPLGGKSTDDHILLYTQVFTTLCDVVSLKLHDFSDAQIEFLFNFFENTFDKVAVRYRGSHEAFKASHSVKVETVQEFHQLLHQARADSYKWDSIFLQLVESFGRLFLLKRLPSSLAPRFLFFWCRSTSKNVSNFFKTFFYSQRDASGDSFALERDTIRVAYDRSMAVGLTPLSIEEMAQLSGKLSSLHFGLAIDRYYTVCIAIVRNGIEFATSVDPLILHAIVPYCAKLKPPEALHLLRHELPSREIFKAASHPCVRSFISALCRAAKVDDPRGNSSSSALSSVGASAKRGRELYGGDTRNDAEETALFDIVQSISPNFQNEREKASASGVLRQSLPKFETSHRLVTEDGWHVRADTLDTSSSPSPSESTQDTSFSQGAVMVNSPHPIARLESAVTFPASYPIASQEPLITGFENDEVFIGREHYA